MVSVNIERSKHLDRVIPFLRERKPDVVCLQELMDYDIPLFERELGAKYWYAGNTHFPGEKGPGAMGVALFTALPVIADGIEYYWGTPGKLPNFDLTNTKTKHDSETRTVLYCDVKKANTVFRIATTHFTWTPDGEPDDIQRGDLARMMPVLEKIGDFVVCGDFNAPRGGEIFEKIAAQYKDNIPERYVWSLDLQIHRGGLEHMTQEAANAGMPGLMVDGLFTTPAYVASDVELHNGVSDHCAITATISRHL